MQICYEIIFSGEVVDRAHRPRILFNPSNDAWFGKWGPPQHLAQARMRAIEEGLPILRATPTGISAIIAADGRLVATVPHETAGAIEQPMPSALPPNAVLARRQRDGGDRRRADARKRGCPAPSPALGSYKAFLI
ncbi:nitrilase-related carbon-nitrogen hydrolase [Sphingomonas sp. H160509]|uniref:nitrilase-related carbon-nitrogen hydrolase n=1 Tax=Sphingomonas sp. H160509 TaxID=2955313 RepID=UPI0031594DB3